MNRLSITINMLLIFLTGAAYSKGVKTIDLHVSVQKNKIEVYNRELSLIHEDAYKGIRLSKAYGEGLAWINGIAFSNGTIEFDVRGENIKMHSFVGIAFHGINDSTFDAIYLRPFRFQETNDTLRKHSIQYISLPDFTWQKLRKDFPDKYENAINPSPDPNSWIHVRVVIEGTSISVFINGNKEPILVVEKVTALHKGKIAFYTADTSGGDFANLKISKK